MLLHPFSTRAILFICIMHLRCRNADILKIRNLNYLYEWAHSARVTEEPKTDNNLNLWEYFNINCPHKLKMYEI